MVVPPSTREKPGLVSTREPPKGWSVINEHELAAEQWGVVSRAQLLDAGLTPDAIRWRAAHRWRCLLPGVYSVHSGRIGLRQAAMAAQLYAGPTSLIAGPAAARLHGLESASAAGVVDVVVPATGRSRTIGFTRITRSRVPEPDPAILSTLRVVSPARAVADTLRRSPTDTIAVEVAIEALQRRIATLADVQHWTSMLGRSGSGRAWRALSAAASGAWSVPEHVLAQAIRAIRTLPDPWLNPALRDCAGLPLTTPDLWFDEVALAVMVHSRRYHSTGDQWDQTVGSDADLTATGIVVVGVTPRQIDTTMPEVLARVERAFAVARRRPRPLVRAEARMRDGVRWAG